MSKRKGDAASACFMRMLVYREQVGAADAMDRVNGPAGLGSIQFVSGSQAGNTFPITKPSITLGREPGNDIVVSDPSVSRHHAQISLSNGTWTILKLAPQNTVTVNQRDVQQSAINDRDMIALGSITFLFSTNASVANAARPGQQASSRNAPPPSAPPTFNAPPVFHPTVAAPSPLQGQRPLGTAQAPEGPLKGPSGTASIPRGVATLELNSNTHPQKISYSLDKPVINIGRHHANDIVIDEPVVSGYHAQIVREGNQLVFIHPHPQHQKTTNGILYQGRAIPGTEQFRKPLERGDIIRIGDEHGSLVTLAYNDGTGAVQDIVPEIRPIPLGTPVITLGRQENNMVVLNHPQVSGYHARLEQVQGGYRIVDLGSTNHVYVNAQQIREQLLKPGDEIRIGPFLLTYTGTQLTQRDESNSIRIDALRLHKEGNNHIVLINDISVAIPPRKFVAVVGGSGAGKSTLMDALNGLRPAQSGTVLYNGQDYYKNLAAFSTQLGYVPQDDIIHRDLTVERALYYAARLRLPNDFTEAQIKQRIDEVLEDVEMTFLLRKLADKGHTIVLITHATNNINACDYVCFLCQGGRLAFFGPPDDAKQYFEKTDFAEIYSALEPTDQNPSIPAEAEAKFKKSPYYQEYGQTPVAQGPAGRALVVYATGGGK